MPLARSQVLLMSLNDDVTTKGDRSAKAPEQSHIGVATDDLKFKRFSTNLSQVNPLEKTDQVHK